MKKTVILLVLLGLIASGYVLYRRVEAEKRAESEHCLTLYGNVEIRRVNLGFRVSGRISEINFEEGDKIKKGETIARLDRVPYEDARSVAEAQVEQAAANYEKLETGSRSQEIDQAKASLNETIASLKVLESDLKRSTELFHEKVIPAQEYDTAIAKRDEAIARKQLAEATLNLLLEGYRKEEIAGGKAQLAVATATLKTTETSLSDTELLCPNDGILLTRVEEVGAVVGAGQVIATLSLKNTVWVYVYVPEIHYGRIVPGMKAEIYTDSRPGKPYPGRVGYRSPEAEFTPKTVQTLELRTDLVYRVRIVVDEIADELPQGLPVTVKLCF